MLLRWKHKREKLAEAGGGGDIEGTGGLGRGSRRVSSGDVEDGDIEMVQESEIVVVPRMGVHRVVGEGEADPELPPYSRGNASAVLNMGAAGDLGPPPPPPLSSGQDGTGVQGGRGSGPSQAPVLPPF